MTTSARAHIRWLRNTAPYINAHRGKTFVLMLGGAVAQHENFPHIIHDIALLNSLGVRLVLIHGSRLQIDQRLQRAGLESAFHEGMRITDNAAMEHVKDAAGSLRAQIEALLSMGLPNSPMQGSRMRVCSGNFVTAQAHRRRRWRGLPPHRHGAAHRRQRHTPATGGRLHCAALAPGLFTHRRDFQPGAGRHRGALRLRDWRRQAGVVRQRRRRL